MKLQSLLLMLILSTTAFGQKTITLLVKENTLPCEGVAPMNCLQVKEGNAKAWSNFYSGIEGFVYQPGYEYKLKVKKIKISKPLPMDAPAYTYHLEKLVYKKQVPPSKVGYINKKMVLTQINGKTIDNGKIYLIIDSAKNSIFGKSGCNRFNANYKLSNNKIDINLLMGTLMACDDESMKLEQEFRNAIEKKGFVIYPSGNLVQFKDPKTKKTVLCFEIPTETRIWSFIDGKNWKLIQLENVGKNYGKAFIQFDAKTKKITGNTGCNRFFGTYTSDRDEITFSNLGSTKMACLENETAATETKMLQLLSGATLRFDIAEQTLNFYKDDKLIMIFGWVR
ncbi:MAG TPA: META domain-containing protein [Flavipsychrobacter sp.]|nr:META domain-containing protein [Flavipsychrobacter sp.]